MVLALVAVLPLHTVYVHAWISWKPYLVLLGVLAAVDLWGGLRQRQWPWHRPATLGLAAFLGVVLLGWPAGPFLDRYLRLVLAVVVGAVVLLVAERHLRQPGALERSLRVVFWTGAAMAVTAFLFSLAAVGAFAPETLPTINELPGVGRVTKMVFLREGFLALTNWHQDPGYAASWMTLWAGLALVASARGLGTSRWWADAAVVGGLAFGVLMTFSRTGWLGLVVGLAVAAGLLVRAGALSWREAGQRLAASVLVAILLLGAVWAVDDPDSGSHLGLSLAFRLGQAGELVGSLFELAGGGVAFEEAFDVSEGRAEVWPFYWELFRSRPLTGVGLGVGWQLNPDQQEPHNLGLELLSETGLLGLAAFLALLAIVVRSGRGLPGTVALVIALLPAFTQTVLFEVSWWFAAGLLLAGGYRPSSTLRTSTVEALPQAQPESTHSPA